MGELTGLLKIKGKIDDFVIYELNGKLVVRRKPNVSKSKREKDPAYERVRESNKEFGGASKLSAWLRTSLRTFIYKDQNKNLNNQLTSAFLKMIQQGPGNRGQRVITWQEDHINLQNILFTSSAAIDHFFTGTLSDHWDNSLLLNLDNFSIRNAPQGTDEFRFSFLILPLPKLTFDQTKKEYKLIDIQQTNISSTELLNPTEIHTQNFNFPLLQPSANGYLIIGMIEFFQIINNQPYQLQSLPVQIMNILTPQ